MTILTQALSEKKLDKLKEPLVDDCLQSSPPQVRHHSISLLINFYLIFHIFIHYFMPH
jgi:hypothetical protein